MWCSCKRCSCASNRVSSLGVMMISLVGAEVGGSDVDVEQVVATGELQWSGFRQCTGPGLQDVGDVLGAERLEGEPVGDRAGHGIGGGDLSQSQDPADVVASVKPALLQAVVIGLGVLGDAAATDQTMNVRMV